MTWPAQPCPGCSYAQVFQCCCMPSHVKGRGGDLALVFRGFQTLVERGLTIPGDPTAWGRCSQAGVGPVRRVLRGLEAGAGVEALGRIWLRTWGSSCHRKLGSEELSSLTSCPMALPLPLCRKLQRPFPALFHYPPAPHHTRFQALKPVLRPAPSQHLITLLK